MTTDSLPKELPVDLLLRKPFPMEALGDYLSPMAMAVKEEVQVPAELAANTVLALSSLATQYIADVELDNRLTPINLYIMSIAESGDRKSATDDCVADPLDAYIRECLSSGDAKLTIKHGDATTDGLLKAFSEGSPSQGVFSDEGGNFFSGHSMKAEERRRTIAILSQLWNGKDIVRTRANDENSGVIVDPRLTIHMMMQPEIAKDVLTDTILQKQGFLARFLISCPESIQGYRPYRSPNTNNLDLIASFKQNIQGILQQFHPHTIEDSKKGLITLGGEAKELWIEFYNSVEMALRVDGKMFNIRPTANKSAEQALRIAAVLRLMENPEAEFIDKQTIKNAIQIENWYLDEARLCFDSSKKVSKNEKAKLLIDWLLELGEPHFVKAYVRNNTLGSLRPDSSVLIDWLVGFEWIIKEVYTNPDTQRKNTRFRLNNHIVDDYATYAGLLQTG